MRALILCPESSKISRRVLLFEEILWGLWRRIAGKKEKCGRGRV